MKNIFLTLMLLTSFSQLSFGNTSKVKMEEFPKKEMKKQKNEITKLMAKELSKNLPQKVDRYTVLRKITSKGSTLIYTFDINTGAKKDETVIREDHSRMKRAVTKGICQTSSKLLDAGINTTYIYKSAHTKKTLFVFKITQSKCIGLK